MAGFGTGTNMRFDCMLKVLNTTTLTVTPRIGGAVFVDGNNYSLIEVITKANTGLVAATLYYAYVYWTGTALAIELSTTGYAANAEYGHYVKSGDASRTFVGMVYMDAGSPGTFVDSDAKRFCASYYNRINKPVQRTVLTGNPNTTSTTYVELTAGDKVEFITFGEEWSNCYYSGCALNATLGNVTGAAIGVNGTGTVLAPNLFNAPVALYAVPISGNIGYKFDPGYNYINLIGISPGGTIATFAGANCGFGAMLRQ